MDSFKLLVRLVPSIRLVALLMTLDTPPPFSTMADPILFVLRLPFCESRCPIGMGSGASALGKELPLLAEPTVERIPVQVRDARAIRAPVREGLALEALPESIGQNWSSAMACTLGYERHPGRSTAGVLAHVQHVERPLHHHRPR